MANVTFKHTRCQANNVGVWHEEIAFCESDQTHGHTNEECMRTLVHLNACNNHAFFTPIDRKDKIILTLNEEVFWVILCWQILRDLCFSGHIM